MPAKKGSRKRTNIVKEKPAAAKKSKTPAVILNSRKIDKRAIADFKH